MLTMEVTRENFAVVLPAVLAEIEACSLVAFDTEFTGLHDGPPADWADQPQDRYCKLRMYSGRFCLVQFGICLFTRAADSPLKYTVKPYNFYIFPLPSNLPPHREPDQRFLCQASSLVLLGDHGTDFNKWIKEGIPYLSEYEEGRWRGQGEESSQLQADTNYHVGFLQVVMAIARSGKPLVGHNCMLDLLHTYSHFIGPLPESLHQFKAELSKRFTHVYDSKVVCQHKELVSLFYSWQLKQVFSRVKQPPFPCLSLTLLPSCIKYASIASNHEAAYDAFITGYSLIAMATYLAILSSDDFDLLAPVRHLENRVFLTSIDGTFSTCLTAPDPPLPRDHVFLITFPEDWTTDDIKNLFSPFGGARVCWLSSRSAHVLLTQRTQAKEAYQTLTSCGATTGKQFTLTPYTPAPGTLSPHTPAPGILSPHTPALGTPSPLTPPPSTSSAPPTATLTTPPSAPGEGGVSGSRKRAAPQNSETGANNSKKPTFELCSEWPQ